MQATQLIFNLINCQRSFRWQLPDIEGILKHPKPMNGFSPPFITTYDIDYCTSNSSLVDRGSAIRACSEQKI